MSETLQVKVCKRCSVEKPLEDFHRQPTGVLGRHSWCRPCANAYERATRNPKTTPEQRTRWNLRSRYGMKPEDRVAMMQAQGGLCAICQDTLIAPKIDHCHETGRVRGLLCHRCNLRLSGIEDADFMAKALVYLAA